MGARSTCGRGGAECSQRRTAGQCERGDGYTSTPHACCHVPPTSTKSAETGRTLPCVLDPQQRVLTRFLVCSGYQRIVLLRVTARSRYESGQSTRNRDSSN